MWKNKTAVDDYMINEFLKLKLIYGHNHGKVAKIRLKKYQIDGLMFNEWCLQNLWLFFEHCKILELLCIIIK